MPRFAGTVIAACLIATPAYAQHEHEESPYAGMESSEIPSLTSQELEDLRSAAGMGFAKAAELNHYPGPKHVLELAEGLELTEAQRAKTLEVQSAMRERATELGSAIIEAERKLNLRFQHGHIDEETLAAMTGEIARLYGELRYTHLRAHLATKTILDEEQVALYDRMRGYGEGGRLVTTRLSDSGAARLEAAAPANSTLTDSLVHEFHRAWNANDLTGMLAQLQPTAFFLSPYQLRYGRDTMARTVLITNPETFRNATSQENHSFVSEHVAWSIGHATSAIFDDEGHDTGEKLEADYLYVFTPDPDGTWKAQMLVYHEDSE